MSQPLRRLSVVPAQTGVAADDPSLADIYRLIDIENASGALHMAAIRLRAIPRYPEIADYRQMMLERFEAAVRLMRETLE